MQDLLRFIEMLPPWLGWLVIAAVAFVVLWRIFHRRYIWLESKHGKRLAPVLAVLIFVFASAASHRLEMLIDALDASAPPSGAADGLRDAFKFLWPFGDAKTVAQFVALVAIGTGLVVFTYLLYRLRYSLFEYDIVEKTDAPPRAAIIMGLSELGGNEPVNKRRIAEVETLTLEDACCKDFGQPYFTWQQNLRVLAHHFLRDAKTASGKGKKRHRTMTRHVIILPSPQSDVGIFVSMAKACLENSGINDVTLLPWPKQVNYGKLAETRDELKKIMAHLRASPDIAARYEDISIDTTPGQKVLSIAAAAVTFASPAEFTYVERDGRVIVFDVVATFRTPPN